jgi:saccharopine dehydrogenase (NAD+, L-lysine-forming)
MLYGAYGTTGRLILDEALRRGHRPLLAGRDGAQLSALGQATGLSTLTLPLDDGAALRAALSRVSCVLLAAGPYSLTGPPMRAACLEAGCSYLDINGALDDFGAALACDAAARRTGIGIIAGVGYGVVFAECLAAQVRLRLPDATWLRLSLATQTAGRSRGATLSVAAALAAGGRDISDGALRTRAIASSTWLAPDAGSRRLRFAAAPMAELLAVQRSTGIPNIVAGIPLSQPAAAVVRVAGPVLGRMLAWQAARTSSNTGRGPSAAAIAGLRSRVWAEAGNAAGGRVAAVLETGEGYRAASAAAVRALELQQREPRVGALTPVQAFGADFALLVPGTRLEEI